LGKIEKKLTQGSKRVKELKKTLSGEPKRRHNKN